MDPNKVLQRIRSVRLLMAVYGTDPPMIRNSQLQGLTRELFEAVGDLDEWLSNGGFLPKDWAEPPLPSDKLETRKIVVRNES